MAKAPKNVNGDDMTTLTAQFTAEQYDLICRTCDIAQRSKAALIRYAVMRYVTEFLKQEETCSKDSPERLIESS